MQKRLAEIQTERMISAMSPVIVGGSLVIPKGLLQILMHEPVVPTFGQGDRQAIEYAGMKAVMDIEKKLGYLPIDVSAKKCGYDIESEIPKDLQQGEGCLRFIEVKARVKGASTVTISKNEMLTGLNRPEEFILAIVEVDGADTKTIYLKKPFDGMEKPSFAEVSRNFSISDLVRNAEVVYQD